MESPNKNTSGFFRAPSIWKIVRAVVVAIGAFFGLLFGIWLVVVAVMMVGAAFDTKEIAVEVRDDPKVFGGGAPGKQ